MRKGIEHARMVLIVFTEGRDSKQGGGAWHYWLGMMRLVHVEEPTDGILVGYFTGRFRGSMDLGLFRFDCRYQSFQAYSVHTLSLIYIKSSIHMNNKSIQLSSREHSKGTSNLSKKIFSIVFLLYPMYH